MHTSYLLEKIRRGDEEPITYVYEMIGIGVEVLYVYGHMCRGIMRI